MNEETRKKKETATFKTLLKWPFHVDFSAETDEQGYSETKS